MIQGHTKFSCDRHFGIAKNKKMKTLESIETIEEVGNAIETSGKNQSIEMMRDFTRNGQRINVYNWKDFLSKIYRKPNSSKKIFHSHMFRFYSDHNNIYYREYFDSEQYSVSLTRGPNII